MPFYSCPDLQAQLEGEWLANVESYKYLGVDLDRNLTLESHISNKISKAKCLLMQLNGFLGYFWGPRPGLMASLYKAVICPLVTYGCCIWVNKISTKLRNKLMQLQRLVLLCIAPALHGTPTAGLVVTYGIEPLPLHIQSTALTAECRLKLQDFLPYPTPLGHRAWL